MSLLSAPDTAPPVGLDNGPVVPPAPTGAAKAPPRTAAEPVQAPDDTVAVLHVVNGEHYSGAERVQDLLALSLPDFGYRVGFTSLKPGLFGDYRQSIGSPLHEIEMRGRWDLAAARRVARVAQEGEYKLLHAHAPRSLMIATLAAKLTGLPLVYHVHSPTSRDSTRWLTNRLNDRLERVCASSCAQLITVSPTLTDHMRLRGVPADRLQCVLNGVPGLTDDQPGSRLRRQPIEPLVIGMVALFRPRKGTEVLLDALAALRARDHEVRLEAIGPFETPEYEAELHARVKKLGLCESVHWAGFTDDVQGALAKVDTLALPSLFGEGLPMVVLEAMAGGLPVVATRCEGTTEAILHRETGMLVEPGCAAQLTDALEELLTGAIDYPEMSQAARDRHADRFSDKAMAKQVAAVYDRVLR